MTKTETKKSTGSTIYRTVGGKEYKIRKLHVGKYARVMVIVEDLPAKLMELYPDKNWDELKYGLESMGIEEMLKSLPKLMEFASNEIINLISFMTDIPEEVFQYRDDMEDEEIVGLDELVELVEDVVVLNNFKGVADKVKNLMSLKG